MNAALLLARFLRERTIHGVGGVHKQNEGNRVRTAVDSGDDAQEDRPHIDEEVSRENVIHCRIAAKLLEDIETMPLDNIFYKIENVSVVYIS